MVMIMVSTTRQGLFMLSPLDGSIIDGIHTGDGFANQTTALQVAGTGADSSGGQIRFNAFRENERPSLQLLGGRVYVAWDSYDKGNYDVLLFTLDKDGKNGDVRAVADSLRCEARPGELSAPRRSGTARRCAA